MFGPGDKLEYGHYTVLRELGAGGMGVVYHCRDEFLQREIAIKMLLPELMADDDTVEIFRQEARLAAQLEHPNVVTIHNIGIENKEGKVHHYIAMEFLPGGSLKQRIVDDNVSMEQSLEWMKQLSIGLNYAHKRNVVHQDIKPDNIFITHEGGLKIGDFGLALIATGVAIERAVQGKGTPAYMSPELCRGDAQDHRSDIYSLGAVFFELLTKEKPYKAAGMMEMAMKHATAPVPSVKKLKPDVPDVLDRAIQKMMAKSPDDRYQSLSEVLTILEKLLLEVQVARLGVGTSAKPESAPNTVPAVKSAPPINAIPNPDSYADDFASFIEGRDQRAGRPAAPPANAGATPAKSVEPIPAKPVEPAPPKPVEPVQPKAVKPPEPSMPDAATDPLDDLLDTLLAEQTGNLPAVDTPKEEEPAKAETTSRSNAQGMGFEDDVTGDIDAVFQSMVRAESAAMAAATHAEAEASQIGKTIPGPASDGRVARSTPTVDKAKQLEVVWTYKTSGPIGWSSAPTQSRDRKSIYVGSSDGFMYSLDAAKGNVQWRYDTGAAIVASPALSGDRLLIASTNGSLHCISNDGKKLWEYSSASPLVATPFLHNEDILLSSMDGTVRYINKNDGSVKWTYRTEGPIVSTPQVLESLVFIGSKDKCVHAISLDKGHRQWMFTTGAPVVASPLVSTDSVYVGSTDGNLYSLEAETGKVVWQYPTEKPIVAKGTLEFTSLTVSSEDKWVHCIEKYKGGLIWKARLHSPAMTNLISSGGNLYIANREGWLQCFSLKNGELKWQANCEKRLEASPLISGKTLVVGMVSGDITAYALPV